MVWQDTVISIINAVFVVSLLPQAYNGFKQKKGYITAATSVPTFIGLYVMAFCTFTLELYYSTATIALCATIWFILFIQRILYSKAWLFNFRENLYKTLICLWLCARVVQWLRCGLANNRKIGWRFQRRKAPRVQTGCDPGSNPGLRISYSFL